MRKRRKLPEEGELVLGTVVEIYEHGAFLKLDEYGDMEAYVPLNEVTTTWFKEIREAIKVGQKSVFKVMRVDQSRGHVDVSLKRVSRGERRAKLAERRRAQRAERLLELAARRLGASMDEAYEEAGWKLEDAYGEIYSGLEEAATRGVEPLLKAGLDERWSNVLAELAEKYVEIPKVRMSGIFELKCLKPDGISMIRRALTEGLRAGEREAVGLRIYVVGAPRYKVDIEAKDYATAESALKRVVEAVLREIEEGGGEGKFRRIGR